MRYWRLLEGEPCGQPAGEPLIYICRLNNTQEFGMVIWRAATTEHRPAPRGYGITMDPLKNSRFWLPI